MLELEFHGAARTVTGSCHLLRVNGTAILLDCGLFQGPRAEAFERNRSFPFDPKEIDLLVLSHAHIDHTGKIPMLVKEGFSGTIFSTPATRDLADVMLMDSAKIQEKDAEFVNKKRRKEGLPPVESIYGMEDVLRAIELFQTVGYERPIRIAEGVTLTYFDAGHILGSALVALDLARNGNRTRLVFTGDLGRPNRPILRDPVFAGDADALISESTYGGRFHLETGRTLERLEGIVRSAVARGGRIVVPAFSVGRTQELVYELHRLGETGHLPDIPIYVDSPLSVNATQIFRIHPECMDAEARTELLAHHDPFGFERLRYVTSVQESKDLNGSKEPMMIIAASGMCEAGRVLHHLANAIGDDRNTILITGYCAEHTLGRRLAEKETTVRIFGETYERRAGVEVMNSLSAHADRRELLGYISRFDRKRLANIFLVHGDYDQQQKLSAGITDELGFDAVHIPEPGDRFQL